MDLHKSHMRLRKMGITNGGEQQHEIINRVVDEITRTEPDPMIQQALNTDLHNRLDNLLKYKVSREWPNLQPRIMPVDGLRRLAEDSSIRPELNLMNDYVNKRAQEEGITVADEIREQQVPFEAEKYRNTKHLSTQMASDVFRSIHHRALTKKERKEVTKLVKQYNAQNKHLEPEPEPLPLPLPIDITPHQLAQLEAENPKEVDEIGPVSSTLPIDTLANLTEAIRELAKGPKKPDKSTLDKITDVADRYQKYLGYVDTGLKTKELFDKGLKAFRQYTESDEDKIMREALEHRSPEYLEEYLGPIDEPGKKKQYKREEAHNKKMKELEDERQKVLRESAPYILDPYRKHELADLPSFIPMNDLEEQAKLNRLGFEQAHSYPKEEEDSVFAYEPGQVEAEAHQSYLERNPQGPSYLSQFIDTLGNALGYVGEFFAPSPRLPFGEEEVVEEYQRTGLDREFERVDEQIVDEGFGRPSKRRGGDDQDHMPVYPEPNRYLQHHRPSMTCDRPGVGNHMNPLYWGQTPFFSDLNPYAMKLSEADLYSPVRKLYNHYDYIDSHKYLYEGDSRDGHGGLMELHDDLDTYTPLGPVTRPMRINHAGPARRTTHPSDQRSKASAKPRVVRRKPIKRRR